MNDQIRNGQKVISKFGYWPAFSDSKVVKFLYDYLNGCIGIAVSYIDVDKNIASIVDLKFSGIHEMEIADLFKENVIDELAIEVGKNEVQVNVVGCYGMRGHFKCEEVEVISVE